MLKGGFVSYDRGLVVLVCLNRDVKTQGKNSRNSQLSHLFGEMMCITVHLSVKKLKVCVSNNAICFEMG